ncbi:fibronectin type III-like domain-contianing protein [Prolixibacteraceae bacterium Z1-6]|uniref:Fibronectin type III-like domain-contianing protein n=1 Tax=Draconibacterium aestuarii TaxID=2998507 RepID=A0A9X3F400_9BACT|nr:fibronectin type III-like domain-contianing protein [Prolixibacteraceae bacterium Z1-6]
MYVNDNESSVATPVKVLKGFKKIDLRPGESKTIDFEITYNELGIWDRSMNYVVEPGEFEIMVGNSSEHIFQKSVVKFE